jgi:hypothetical protein
MEVLSLPPGLKALLRDSGIGTVEEVLPGGHLDDVDEALTAIGLFRVRPLMIRDWQIYYSRSRGETFSSLAKIFSLSPEGARLAFYKVKVTLESEMKVREVLDSGLAARAHRSSRSVFDPGKYSPSRTMKQMEF